MKTLISPQDGLCLTLEAAIAEFLADCRLHDPGQPHRNLRHP